MTPLNRFAYHRKRLRRKLGAGGLSREVDRHLSHAAEIEQVLEMARHQMMAGHQFDPESIAALRDQIPVALLAATIAASP